MSDPFKGYKLREITVESAMHEATQCRIKANESLPRYRQRLLESLDGDILCSQDYLRKPIDARLNEARLYSLKWLETNRAKLATLFTFVEWKYVCELGYFPMWDDVPIDKFHKISPAVGVDDHLSFVFVSHRWLSPDHPDPNRTQLQALKEMMQEGNKYIWYDFSCMPQKKPRSEANQEIFGNQLKELHLLTTCLFSFVILTEDYYQRSWCMFEWATMSRCAYPPNSKFSLTVPFSNSTKIFPMIIFLHTVANNNIREVNSMTNRRNVWNYGMSAMHSAVINTIMTAQNDRRTVLGNLYNSWSQFLVGVNLFRIVLDVAKSLNDVRRECSGRTDILLMVLQQYQDMVPLPLDLLCEQIDCGAPSSFQIDWNRVESDLLQESELYFDNKVFNCESSPKTSKSQWFVVAK